MCSAVRCWPNCTMSLHGLLPFVRSERSCYWWRDCEGVQHPIWQGEGGEQGDPDAPALQPCHSRCITRHATDEELFAFLDDVYTSSPPGRTRTACDALAVPRKAGIQLHTGKTRVWNVAGFRPVIWKTWAQTCRIHEESKFWGRQLVRRSSSRRCAKNGCNERGSCGIPWVLDLQCAWQVFLAATTCSEHWHQKVLKIMRSGTMTGCSRQWTLLHGLSGEGQQHRMARHIATLPMRLGGLGLRAATRTAPGASGPPGLMRFT